MTDTVRQIDSTQVKGAYQDLITRIEHEGVNLVYDATLDSLFIEFGGPEAALSEHVADNIMIRINPETLRVVGFEVVDFLEDFMPHNRLLALAMEDFPIRKGEDFETTIAEPKHIRFIESFAGLTAA